MMLEAYMKKSKRLLGGPVAGLEVAMMLEAYMRKPQRLLGGPVAGV